MTLRIFASPTTLPTALALVACTLGACTGGGPSPPPIKPPGADESLRTNVLEAGATVLQRNSPLARMDIHLVGFHPIKDDPDHQVEAHHFCRQVNEDFAQCALFDGNTAAANLNGVEYIISARLFKQLPPQEREYWHPHNGEILLGQLVAPTLPAAAEQALMRSKINSYGKTWHTWSTGRPGTSGDRLPLGPAHLAWSFNRDGEVDPSLVAARDRRMGIATAERREARQDLLELARPQSGVDALKGRFPRPTHSVPGVVGTQAASAAAASAADQRPPDAATVPAGN